MIASPVVASSSPVPSQVHRSAIYLIAGHWGAEVNGSPRDALSLALTKEGDVYVDNRTIAARFVTVEIRIGSQWHKAFQHDGRTGTNNMQSCKLRLRHGCVHAVIDGREFKPSAARFEVVA